ncbi:MAG TPA: serine hydrolase domain-containing protein [Steroidobacteraceae bacterium]|jgi:CubicO group peptidase (beta-lactamase class C family)|nr:serine hydrolase domain-containing protein [Steroidobacteraceae bacterium]
MRRVALAAIAVASLIPALTQSASAPAELTGEARARIDGAIDRAIAEKRIVGAVVLVSHDGKVVYQRAAGLADRESKRPMQLDTTFRLASVSKPIVSAAALVLVDQGKLSLDDPVTKWLPDFRPKLASGTAPTITVRQLLTHTSGLSYKFAEKTGTAYYQAGVSDGFDELRISLDENLRRLASTPLFNKPGEAFRYSLSIDVLGAVVEKAAGKPLQQAVADLVTQPLNMRDTGFSAKEPARLAVPYHDAKPAPAPMSDPYSMPFGEGGRMTYSPSRALDAKAYPSGGAGMVGTAPDVMRLLEAVRAGGKPILKEATAASMMRNQIGSLMGPGPGVAFGFGGAVVVDPAAAQSPQSAGTWQWGGVYGHSWFVDPAKKLTVVALTNTALEGMWGKFTTDVRDAVYESVQ